MPNAKMKREEIDREAVIAAVETEMPHIEHFLDLDTGEILTTVGPVWDEEADADALDEIARDNRLLARRVRAEPSRYERVPSIAPEAAFGWMQEWASTVANRRLRANLQKALRECKDDCFQAFRQVLVGAPEQERERWFAFRNEKIEEFIDAWLGGRKKDAETR